MQSWLDFVGCLSQILLNIPIISIHFTNLGGEVGYTKDSLYIINLRVPYELVATLELT